MLRRSARSATQSGVMRVLSYAFAQVIGARIEEARLRAERRASEILGTLVLRLVGAFLAMLAVVWLSIGATLALSTEMQIWWACFIVSGTLALGALILFTVKFRRPRDDRSVASRQMKEADRACPDATEPPQR
jgi:uncharacterized membrane protein